MKTWIITGCSSGLGKALAEAVLKRGWNAVVTARNIDSIKQLVDKYPAQALACSLDVTRQQDVTDVIDQAMSKFGVIDVLVNNAGYGYRSAIEEAVEQDIDDLFNTNVFGPVRLMKAVLPGMRALKRGTIINISSIAAQTAHPGSGYYSATKRALEGISESLYKETAPLGITVMVVEPGAFRTEFAGRSLKESPHPIGDYAGTAGLRRIENDHSQGTQPGDPTKAAELIIDVSCMDKKPFRLLMGSDAVNIVTEALGQQLSEVTAWSSRSITSDY